jgi:hypothetical protein
VKRLLLVLALGLLVLLLAGLGTATASPLPGQITGQAAGSGQTAGSVAGTAQQEPSNANGSIRVLSKGDDGSVTQSNDASSNATAANQNETKQDADQTGGSGDQVIGQSAQNSQDALAAALTLQKGASNVNTPTHVLAPGDAGSVSQSNTASSDAAAGNTNKADQSADQDPTGSSCCGGSGSQVIGQSAENEQDAAALAATDQENPSNQNVSVRVLSPGDDGSVSQSNEATSNATAANENQTKQDADQSQTGGSCECGSAGDQVIGQSAQNDQDAKAASLTAQKDPSNQNISVRVLSPGDSGDVSQSNVASSNAAAGNTNKTNQDADQSQSGDSCKCGSGGTQLIGQSADSEQSATAVSATSQDNPSNKNVSVRVLSPGDDGSVSQSNEATSNATAANENQTKQEADQDPTGGSGGLQAIGQSATNDQSAFALGLTLQKGASNENNSVRVLSPGDGGDVSQSNVASSDAAAGNTNKTDQDADQSQSGDSCKCGSGGAQLIGQSADSEQAAAALSATIQKDPSNSNDPIRVLSKGDDGSVSQSNEASSDATAANMNETKQDADQSQAGGSGLQAIGQESKNGQFAAAAALTAQLGASNENAPLRVLSRGDGGDVTQSNDASSTSSAGNTNRTDQDADQSQTGGSCKCGSSGIQAIGQSSKNWQGAKALAFTLQLGLKPECGCKGDSGFGNNNDPTRVLSRGDDGSVEQSNDASSDATAGNSNRTKQDADQSQGGGKSSSCPCNEGLAIQALGQEAISGQFAASLAATLQLGAANGWAPDRKDSPGKSGDLSQNGQNSANDGSGSQTGSNQSNSQAEGR